MISLKSLAAGANEIMTSRFGRAAVVGGAVGAAMLGSDSANNESARMLMNAVIGTPEDGPGADEIILGRKIELGDFFNPIAPYLPDLPGNLGPGWQNLKYALQPGPGIVNPAIGDFRGAMEKRNAFISDYKDENHAEMMSDNIHRAFNSRQPRGNLNASGDIVLGAHRRRFGN